ncbi:MAG TPA: O-antigen ligase family protein [Pyrinomonadaceae bacterium]|nr:O-antigen ligase family protein [Pyrinomonadaceae bacterium]
MPREPQNRQLLDYEPVAPARGSLRGDDSVEGERLRTVAGEDFSGAAETQPPATSRESAAAASAPPFAPLRRGHALSYAGLFLFTAVVYFRPYELIPALAPLSNWLAFSIAILTLLAYVPAQLGLEGTLTVRPREVNCVLLLCLAGLLSIPLAADRGEAWETFVGYTKVVIMFVVMVNVVRTEARLRRLALLVWASSIVLSLGAVADFRAGRFETGGERIAGVVGGMFGNPNDLAMHLAMMVALSFALLFSSRSALAKLVFLGGAFLMSVATVLTYSRGGFLGLAAAAFVVAWKLGRRHRLAVVLGSLALVVAFLALAPGDYTTRLTSIFDKSLDVHGSASARQAVLWRSVNTIIHNPVFGVGMGCFHILSIREQVSHNAYTQVGAEMGVAALLAYVMFLLAPFKRLRQVERETLGRRRSRDYYWAVGLQASLVAYMVSSFFGSVAYLWYIYYLVGFGYCFHRLYEAREAEARAAGEAKAGDRPSHSDWDEGAALAGAARA